MISAWEARVLPLHYARRCDLESISSSAVLVKSGGEVEGEKGAMADPVADGAERVIVQRKKYGQKANSSDAATTSVGDTLAISTT